MTGWVFREMQFPCGPLRMLSLTRAMLTAGVITADQLADRAGPPVLPAGTLEEFVAGQVWAWTVVDRRLRDELVAGEAVPAGWPPIPGACDGGECVSCVACDVNHRAHPSRLASVALGNWLNQR